MNTKYSALFEGRTPPRGRMYYLAHPFTTYDGRTTTETERRAFKLSAAGIAARLRRWGIEVISPLNLPLGRLLGPNNELSIDESRALKQCNIILTACDGIILSPGWQHSTGCRKEVTRARILGLDVFEINPPEEQDRRYREYLAGISDPRD